MRTGATMARNPGEWYNCNVQNQCKERVYPVQLPPLQPLHPDHQLLELKLTTFRRLTTNVLLASLRPGQPSALKTREDGTILDGHHRLKVLRERGVNVNDLPREVLPRGEF